jgi:hypothetical protein
MVQTDAGSIDAVANLSSVRLGARFERLGWAMFAVTSVACAVAVALDLHTGTYATLAYVAATQAIASMAVLLTSRLPQHRISWVMAVGALWWGISNLAFAYAVEAVVADPGSLPGASPWPGSTNGHGCPVSRCSPARCSC